MTTFVFLYELLISILGHILLFSLIFTGIKGIHNYFLAKRLAKEAAAEIKKSGFLDKVFANLTDEERERLSKGERVENTVELNEETLKDSKKE